MKVNGIKSTCVHAASSIQAIQYESDFAAHNYHPLPVVMAKGEGVLVWDPEVSFVMYCNLSVGYSCGRNPVLMSLLLYVRSGQRIPRLLERVFSSQPGSLSP